jgi:hypothetical protein
MTRKDYELIATVIRVIREDFENGPVSLDVVAGELATAFAMTNKNFNEQLFLAKTEVPV